jgi:guanosine-3',5'-bis(diphosphate) 3'-pyrophosphohydrolase
MQDPIDKDLDFILNPISANSYKSQLNIEKIKQALVLCRKYHANQKRESGEFYYTHPIEVARILVELRMDTDTVVAGLLHDTVEDTELTLNQISEIFSPKIADLVDGVTKLNNLSLKAENIKQAENFKKLILASSKDMRVLVVKLTDRLHNMRTLKKLDKDKKIKKALETLEIYAPLAGRVGLQGLKLELQDIAFSILYPSISNSITSKLNKLIGNDNKCTEEIIGILKGVLQKEGIEAQIYGRKKTAYSIWMKMKQKNVSFEQLSDVIAFRIIVNEVMDCYKVLGVIHQNYKMVPDNFQDFISLPKSNGYQSIHTIVIGPLAHKIEIQIRTENMHILAEYGFAAHWIYKEYAFLNHKYEWVSDLLNIVDQDSDPEEFLHNTKLAVYYDQIFCFTPKGKIISLPKDATILDFAYNIDTQIGNHCIGGLANGLKVENNYIIMNGDQITILTSPTQRHSIKVLDYLVTGKARSIIQQSVCKYQDEFIDLGKKIVETMLGAYNIQNHNQILLEMQKQFNQDNLKNLYHAIGNESISKIEIYEFLQSKKTSELLDSHKLLTATIKCVLNKKLNVLGDIIKILVESNSIILDLEIKKSFNELFEIYFYLNTEKINCKLDEIFCKLQITEDIKLVVML